MRTFKRLLAVITLLPFLMAAPATVRAGGLFYEIGGGFIARNAPDYDADGDLRPFVEITFPRRCRRSDEQFQRCTSEALLKFLGPEAFAGGAPRFLVAVSLYDGLPPHLFAPLDGGHFVHVFNLVRSPKDRRRIGVAVLIT